MASWTISHDFAFQYGGAEWVTEVLAREVLPDAQVHYLAGHAAMASALVDDPRRLKTLLPKFVTPKNYRAISAAYPSYLRLRSPVEGNLLASSYGFAHQVRARGKVVVYCHSPLRQAWSGRNSYLDIASGAERLGLRLATSYLRNADRRAASRASLYVATSKAVATRIRQYYGISDVPIVAPPIDNKLFSLSHRQRRGYLFVGRVVEPYKRLGVLLETFRSMPGRHLTVIGDGRDRARLQAVAPPNIDFLGWRTPQQVAEEMSLAQALIFPSEDDFGLVPVQATACGTPVIAYRGGGALDTIQAQQNGLFFSEATPQHIRSAIEDFEKQDWDERLVASGSERYAPERFAESMRQILLSVA